MHTNSEKDAFLLYDFIDRRIRPKYYSIKAKTNNDSNHPRSWKILGSNDKITWDSLDVRTDNESLCGIGASDTFKIKKDLDENQCYRYLKLLQTDVNSSCYYYLALTNLEFFGTIYEPL